MEESPGPCCHSVSVQEPRGFVGAGFSANTIFLGIQEKRQRKGCQELHIGGVQRDDAVRIVKLHVPHAELGGAAVGVSLRVFTRSEAEEKGDHNEVSPTLCEGVQCGPGHSEHHKP